MWFYKNGPSLSDLYVVRFTSTNEILNSMKNTKFCNLVLNSYKPFSYVTETKTGSDVFSDI